MRRVLLLTCEHAGNKIPADLRGAFAGQKALLATHRGWDIGALPVAQALAADLRAPLFYSEVSRLVIELNRSPHHPSLFSRFTKPLPRTEKVRIIETYYRPHRDAVQTWIAKRVGAGGNGEVQVVHLAIHSFTPELNGEVRACELGLLYDPGRKDERAYAGELMTALRAPAAEAGYRLRRNYPYHGAADGFMTHLRKAFSDRQYAGLEIEMSQALAGTAAGRRQLTALLAAAVRETLWARRA